MGVVVVTPSPFLLTETEDQASPRESSRTLRDQATTPASEAFVLEVQRKCPIRAWATRVSIFFAVAIGATLTAQLLGYFALKAAFESSVRTVVIDVLKDKKIIAETPPTTFPTTVVATLPGGTP